MMTFFREYRRLSGEQPYIERGIAGRATLWIPSRGKFPDTSYVGSSSALRGWMESEQGTKAAMLHQEFIMRIIRKC